MDYYKILEVNRDANQDEIKKSYRKLAMKWHPDRNKSDKKAEEKFKEIQTAYDILSDVKKRAEYDANLNFAKNRQYYSNSKKNRPYEEFSDRADFEDIFKKTFGNAFNKMFVQSAEIEIGFWEAIKGVTKTLQINLSGNNKIVKFNFKIPQGVNTGDTFLLDVSGEEIEITVNVRDDSNIVRDNLDLYLKVDIPFTTAGLGGKVIFPHWEGDIEINLPAGLKSNQKVLIANRGVKKGMFTGDLYLIVNISMPEKLTEEQKNILREFDKTMSQKGDWFSKIKTSWSKMF